MRRLMCVFFFFLLTYFANLDVVVEGVNYCSCGLGKKQFVIGGVPCDPVVNRTILVINVLFKVATLFCVMKQTGISFCVYKKGLKFNKYHRNLKKARILFSEKYNSQTPVNFL